MPTTTTPAPTKESTKPAGAPPAVKDDSTGKKPTCPKCGTTEPWGLASWCPRCGYYPQLGTVIDPEGKSGWQEQEVVGPVNIWQAIPPWAWVCGVGVVGIFFASLFCRVAIHEASSARLLWSLLQLVIGVVATFCAQVAAYLYAVPKSDKIHPADILMKPIEIWKPTIKALPATAKRVWLGAWGATAVVCALFITGGIPWEKAFDDWGFEKKAQKNLLQSIVDKARKERDGQEESLEDAMDQFTGKPTVPEEPAKPLMKLDCLIIGYTKDPEGDLYELILASAPRGPLEVVGVLPANTIPRDIRDRLLDRMESLHRRTPLMKSRYSANWLEPVLMIRIGHEDWTQDKQVKKAQFEEILKDVDQ